MMKKLMINLGIVLGMAIAPARHVNAQDPITLVIKEGVKKVLKAVDLKIQRLQNKTIWLQNAQKVMENTMSQVKLQEIAGWVERQRTLYQDYFEELQKVKNVLSDYYRIKEVTELQMALVREYKRASDAVKRDKHFTVEEVSYISEVYSGIIEESLKNLDQLSLVVNSFTTQMSDASRMEIINTAAGALQQLYADLRAFTTQNMQLSLQRSKDARDVTIVKALYGLQ